MIFTVQWNIVRYFYEVMMLVLSDDESMRDLFSDVARVAEGSGMLWNAACRGVSAPHEVIKHTTLLE